MPIRPENKARYPENWASEIVPRIRKRSGNKCEACGVPNYELGGRGPTGIWHKARPLGEKLLRLEWPAEGEHAWCQGYDKPLRIVRIVLTVAHLDHTPENCSDENLRHWCQRCHNAYDAPMRASGIRKRRNETLGQEELFDSGYSATGNGD